MILYWRTLLILNATCAVFFAFKGDNTMYLSAGTAAFCGYMLERAKEVLKDE